MRQVPNKQINEREDWAANLALILAQPANGQATSYAEMVKTVPLIEKIEAARGKDSYLLEEEEWSLLCTRVRAANAGFTRNGRAALEMCEAILNAPQVEVEAKGPRAVGK